MPVDLWRHAGQFLEPCVVWTRVYDEFRCMFPRERANKDVTAARAREDIRKGLGGIAMYSHPAAINGKICSCCAVPNHTREEIRDLVHPTASKNSQEARIAEIRAQAETRTFAAYRLFPRKQCCCVRPSCKDVPLVELRRYQLLFLVAIHFRGVNWRKRCAKRQAWGAACNPIGCQFISCHSIWHSWLITITLNHTCFVTNKLHRHHGTPTSRTSLYTTRVQGPSSHRAATIDGRSIAGEPRRCEECTKTSFKDSGQN